MRLNNVSDVEALLAAVDTCEHDVWLTSVYGDRFNLKSRLNRYVAIAALLGERGNELELWCMTREDEVRMLNFLHEHPEIVR